MFVACNRVPLGVRMLYKQRVALYPEFDICSLNLQSVNCYSTSISRYIMISVTSSLTKALLIFPALSAKLGTPWLNMSPWPDAGRVFAVTLHCSGKCPRLFLQIVTIPKSYHMWLKMEGMLKTPNISLRFSYYSSLQVITPSISSRSYVHLKTMYIILQNR